MNTQVLVVDDDHWLRESLSMLLEPEGCEVTAVRSAEEGLEALEEAVFDIIMVDYALPGMNGVQFLKRARNLSPGAFRVFFTAYGSEPLFALARKLGAGACLHKPLSAEKLQESLEDCPHWRSQIA